MKDFKEYSDDDLLDLLESLDLELSCLIGTEEGDTVEKMYWMVMEEVNRRDLIMNPGEEKERGIIDSLREDKNEVKDNFGFGRDYEDDGYGDLPF
tara:strand:- start:199 stop:483 length:285 start_codon:yes stop_codon:yes gene_type:complete